MKKAVLAVFLFCGACALPAGDVVTLTPSERAKVQEIAEQRQELQSRAQETQNKYQADMNRISEVQNELNLQSAQLCFEFKRAHHLDPKSSYFLDEWGGQLIRNK